MKKNLRTFCFSLLLVLAFALPLRAATVKGMVTDAQTNEPLFGALVHFKTVGAYTDQDGNFVIEGVAAGKSWMIIRMTGYGIDSVEVDIPGENDVIFVPEIKMTASAGLTGKPVVITDVYTNRPAQKLQAVDGTSINAGKKNDVVVPAQLDGNAALNNPRQLFARVPGISIWENDGTGTGVNIAARGLSPNRSWEFNTRQNGYDIASDPIGYPEAYYAPVMEGIERVEIIRGAAALQYGPQFGGMVNYVFKKGPENRKIAGDVALTGGSYGLANGFTSIGGTVGKLNYYGYYNYRRADGWRENSAYFTNAAYANAEYKVTPKLKLGAQYTAMYYVLQQPGGLTDSLFKVDPRASYRERNWFGLRWNMPAFTADYISGNVRISMKAFGLVGERNSVGYTGTPNTNDNNGQRTVDRDYYKNYGAELRTLWQYKLIGEGRSALAAGVRYFRGNTIRRQGKGTAGDDAEFIFADPANLSRDLDLGSMNAAFFIENMFQLGKLRVIPGVRYEMITTSAEGKPAVQREERSNSLPLFGVAAEYALPFNISLYGNWSQAYRPVTFNELWTSVSTMKIDPDLQPVTGWNSDLGVRGSIANGLYYDINMFYLIAEGRIGDVSMTDSSGTYLFRTNTGNSRNHGMEAYIDVHPFTLLGWNNKAGDIGFFGSAGYLEAYYTEGANASKRVEYAPRWTLRTGMSYQVWRFSTTFTWSYTDGVYADAKNTVSSANGTSGWIPHYNVLDWSFTLRLPKNIAVKGSIYNLADNKYFTRRAGGYPGPGIISADGRTIVLTVGAKF